MKKPKPKIASLISLKKRNKILFIYYKIQSEIFTRFVDLAKQGWKPEVADSLFNNLAQDFFPSRFKRTDEAIREFLDDCKSKNLSTSRLYLQTWFSLVNSEINTAGGKK